MSNPTTPFSWQMPTATDLVTDLPADFEVFGQAVATSMADLLGGTTGQILAKNSNTNMDFVWIANDQGDITGITAGNGISVTDPTGPVPTVAINTAVTADLTTAQTLTNKTLTSPVLTTPTISTINAKGDLLAGTADNTIAALTVGANDTVLTADSTAATGLKWATAPTPSYTWTSFTPTWANLTVGNGTVTAFQITIGKLYTYYINLVFGSTTSIAGHVKIPNPVTSSGYATIASPISKVICYDSSAAKQYEAYGETGDSGTRNNLLISDVSGTYPDAVVINATQPFTWTTNDELRVVAQYRIA